MMVFPTDNIELAKMKRGSRWDAIVPLPPGASLSAGDRITFREAIADVFNVPRFLPDGGSVTVTLIKVRDENWEWMGQRLHYVAWQPLGREDMPPGDDAGTLWSQGREG